MAIDGVGWDWSYMANEGEDYALVADTKAPIEFALMANTESKVFDNSLCSNDSVAQLEGRLVEYKEREVKYIEKIRTLEMYRASNLKCIKTLDKELEELKLENDGLDGKLAGLLKASKNLDNLIESQRSDKVKEGVVYNAVPHPATDLYLSPKKDLSWTGLPEFVDDTVTDYSRPSPTVASTSAEGQNKDSSTSEDVASPNTPKPFVKLVKPKDSQSESPEFVLNKKACYNCGDFSHLDNDCRKRVQRGTSRSQNHAHMGPSHRSAGHRPHGPLMNPIRPNMNGARPNRSFFIQAPSYETRPFLKSSAVKTQYKAPWGSSQNNIDDKGYWDNGCSRHMTGNISYLSDFEPSDGGYVSFGQGGCKITGKGTIKTECIVLGRNFKLLDDANILLRTPRQHNMYSIDLNNIVPHKDLTCLVAKASVDECILWHRRLVHSNVKTMNKLVRHNLVRGLATKSFDNDHTCTACLKGKQHKASCTKDAANQEVKKDVSSLRYIALPNWAHDALLESSSSKPHDERSTKVPEGSGNSNSTASLSNPLANQMEILTVESPIPTVSSPVPTACLNDSPKPSSEARLISKRVANQEETPSLDNILSLTNRFEDILGVTTSSNEAIGVEANVSNTETTISASPTTTLRIHKYHPKSQIIGPVDTPIQTRHKSKEVEEQSFIATIYQKTDPALLQFCLFSCFLSQVEHKNVFDALQDPSWVEAMQEELLQFKIKKVWTLVDCPKGARLVAQGHTQEEGIDYDEVFAPVARIKAIRLFLAYASFMGFTVYQMDVKSAFLYGTIDEEVYAMQPPGFQDLTFPAKVYKVEKAMYGLHQAPRAWYGTLSKYLLKNGFQRGTID
nr:hypothetical protein [Tanacetum cinerariifolium]